MLKNIDNFIHRQAGSFMKKYEEKETSNQVEWWRVGYGDYSLDQTIDWSVFGDVADEEATIEGFLIFSINQLLEIRKAKSDLQKNQVPIIVVDFGSTQAHSMVRLVEKFKQQIADGDLVLVCTNLSHQPNQKKEAAHYDGYADKNVAQINEDAVPGYYRKANQINWLLGRAGSFNFISKRWAGKSVATG